MTVNAGRYVVELKELSWWESEEIKAALISGAKMGKDGAVSSIDGLALLDIKVKTFSKCISSIKEGEVEIKFSNEWLKGLTSTEGDALTSAIDELGKKK